jgi:uncharacterized membrane protein YfcA
MSHMMLYILTGMTTGVVTGLLGGGSGPILVPILAMLLMDQTGSPTLAMHMAVGTALAIALLAMITSIMTHHRHLSHIKTMAFALLPGGLIGSIVGTVLATSLSGATFKLMFGMVVLSIGLYTLLQHSSNTNVVNLPVVHKQKFFWISIPLGVIATCFGIGMGPLCVPLLKKYGLTMAQAIAAATLVGMILVIFATGGFVIAGYYHGQLIPHSVGYVYLPMLAWIGIPTIIFARVGAQLTHRFSQRSLKTVFTTFLFVIGIKMMFF